MLGRNHPQAIPRRFGLLHLGIHGISAGRQGAGGHRGRLPVAAHAGSRPGVNRALPGVEIADRRGQGHRLAGKDRGRRSQARQAQHRPSRVVGAAVENRAGAQTQCVHIADAPRYPLAPILVDALVIRLNQANRHMMLEQRRFAIHAAAHGSHRTPVVILIVRTVRYLAADQDMNEWRGAGVFEPVDYAGRPAAERVPRIIVRGVRKVVLQMNIAEQLQAPMLLEVARDAEDLLAVDRYKTERLSQGVVQPGFHGCMRRKVAVARKNVPPGHDIARESSLNGRSNLGAQGKGN